jgi:8-oxo-dGTP pyrophosphatase MutT (NUDIX family)
VVTLADIKAALASHAPRVLDGTNRAAVALVLHDHADGPELLFIERATRLTDPWSGQMAFPGGRLDPGDADERAAAERETLEEVGLDLRDAEPLGRLGDVNAGIRLLSPLVLSAFVYRIPTRPELVPNHEVREALWVPIGRLVEPARHIDHRWGLMRHPGILVGEPDRHVVWGLTRQIVSELLEVAGLRW